MAMIKCSECGKEISDKATSCPNCGAPVEQSAISSFDASNYSGSKQKVKDSTLSIVSCVLTFIACFAFNWLALGGVICGLIDLAQNDKSKRHIGSIFGVVVGAIALILWISALRRLAF